MDLSRAGALVVSGMVKALIQQGAPCKSRQGQGSKILLCSIIGTLRSDGHNPPQAKTGTQLVDTQQRPQDKQAAGGGNPGALRVGKTALADNLRLINGKDINAQAHRQGLALGLASAGSGVSTVFAPVLLTRVMERSGMAAAFLWEGGAIFVCGALVWMLVRDDPSGMGLEPYRRPDSEAVPEGRGFCPS